jgi:flagellar assembly protein FliH
MTDGSQHTEDHSSANQSFVADYSSHKNFAPVVPRLPRNWLEVESLVQDRLKQFELRHQAECNAAFEEGIQEGMRRREEEIEGRLHAARKPWLDLSLKVTNQLRAYRDELYDAATSLAAGLGVAWFRRIVAINPVVFRAALEDALEPLSHQETIEIRLHPKDYAVLADALADSDELFGSLEGVKLREDASLSPGGLIAESAGGSVDARLETRLTRALEVLELTDHDHKPGIAN